jgi:glycosyltransferase involved in cell wall biosynthesis/SAM-dependent methyltransferase
VNRISPRLPGSEATPRLAFVTVGDTGRRTGGYLYHAEVFARLGEMGVTVEEIIPCGASMEEQQRAASRPGSLLDPSAFDVIVVDALARIVCAPHLDRWREKRPVVAMIHELPGVANPEEAGREYEFEKPLLRSNLLVCASEHGKSILEERGIHADCLRIVPPGFDRISRAEGGSPDREDGTLRVLCVGQWIPRKGILDLVRAWTAHERSGATLELVGETDADSGYTAAIREAISGGESIVVRGSVDDATLAEAYAAADFFALPSRYEGYGIVLAEALAYGLPVVACDVGPVPELVGSEAAILVPPGEVAALSEALDLLLRDASVRRCMSGAARRRAEKLPRWDDTAAWFLEVLREVAGGSPGRDLREQNRLSWNAVVGAHDSHRKDLAGFLRAGGSTLFPEERWLLGDVRGKKLLHLQCNSGGDTLSLARLGAAVTGVDISDAAISAACKLSSEARIHAGFERADLYDWLDEAARNNRRFDVAFASYGVVCWLSDLQAWARGISAVLEPGGRFVLVDFHPAADMLDENFRLARGYPSGGAAMALEEGIGDYVGESRGGLTPAGQSGGVKGFENPEPAHLFRWGLGETVTALAGAGLRMVTLEEYPYSNGERHFARMREMEGRRMFPPEDVPAVPLMYGIRAKKV